MTIGRLQSNARSLGPADMLLWYHPVLSWWGMGLYADRIFVLLNAVSLKVTLFQNQMWLYSKVEWVSGPAQQS